MTGGGKKKGALSRDDKAVWQAVAETVVPLKNRPKPDIFNDAIQVKAQKIKHKVRQQGFQSEVGVSLDDLPRPQGNFDRKTHRKLAKGQKQLDGVIDLHGLSREQAYQTLCQKIPVARASGARCLLVVTGKGSARFAQTDPVPIGQRKYQDFQLEGGVLKQNVPSWLRDHRLSPHVSSFETSHKNHGGDGALYVMLRKLKRDDAS